ncbi:TIGR02594 family protein [Flavobacteriaceae bacterium (ex Bugula neritina AB1)]|nr:TIGR02594 family protein [Flavobacteriaceae bacterium (ex Bugula neritina AB1)]
MDILKTALSQYGVKEIAGSKDNFRIVSYFDELGFNGSQLHDETAWCSAFANWVAKKCGYSFSGKLNARSWLNIGESTSKPAVGDIVVLWRESPDSWKGHVGFFIKETKSFVYILGGNQGNRVCIKAYPKDRVLDYKKLIKNG